MTLKNIVLLCILVTLSFTLQFRHQDGENIDGGVTPGYDSEID